MNVIEASMPRPELCGAFEMQTNDLPTDDLPVDVDEDIRLRVTIGRQLGEHRRKIGQSQETAARGIGLSRPHLSNIERGVSTPGWAGLKKMAAHYHLDDTELKERGLAEMKQAPLVRNVKPDAPPLTPPEEQADEDTVAIIAAYSAKNLKNDEKLTMSYFHILPDGERRRLMGMIMAAIQGKLANNNAPP